VVAVGKLASGTLREPLARALLYRRLRALQRTDPAGATLLVAAPRPARSWRSAGASAEPA
jgi:hypothetical protein